MVVAHIIQAYMFSEIYLVLREINYIITHFPQVYINADKDIK